VAANLTFAVPGIGLGLTLLGLGARPGRFLRLAIGYCLPAVLAALLFVAIPLSSAHQSNFYFGDPTIHASVADLSVNSFLSTERAIRLARLSSAYVHLFGEGAAWIAIILSICLAWLVAQSSENSLKIESVVCLRLAGGTLLLSVALLILAHKFSNLLYPSGRTGLYLLFLLPLVLTAEVDRLFGFQGPVKFVGVTVAALLTTVSLLYVLEFQTGYYIEWPYATDVKDYLRIVRDQARITHRTVRIGGSSVFVVLVYFYQDMYKWDWLAPLEWNSLTTGYDWYIFIPDDLNYVSRLRLRKLKDTGRSVLAIPLVQSTTLSKKTNGSVATSSRPFSGFARVFRSWPQSSGRMRSREPVVPVNEEIRIGDQRRAAFRGGGC
jgi:hypothetical protein